MAEQSPEQLLKGELEYKLWDFHGHPAMEPFMLGDMLRELADVFDGVDSDEMAGEEEDV